jgi:hypothetical protein
MHYDAARIGYGDFEGILARIHRVDDADRAAFRSRLRFLRDAGVPFVAKPGKGQRISYSFEDLWDTHLGLHLDHFGLPPSRIKSVMSENIEGKWLKEFRHKQSLTEADVWAFFRLFNFEKNASPEDMEVIFRLYTLDELAHWLKMRGENDPPMLYAEINVSALTRELQNECP